jgi:hypothetical protein
VIDGASEQQAAALGRAELVLADLELLDMTALSRISLSRSDVDARTPAREVAVRAAERAGLGILLADARATARSYVIGAFDNAPFRGIGIDLAESRSRASADDRVAVMMAADDAVIAAVADPFVSEDVRDALSTPFQHLHPAWDPGDPIPIELAERHRVATRWSTYVAFVALVLGSLLLLALGSGVGLFGLAAAIAIVLVALVVRGRPAA